MITTLSGTNEFAIEEELKKLIKQFSDKYNSSGIEQIDGSENDYQNIYEVISNLSFLSPNKLVVLKRGSLNKQFVIDINKVLESVPESTELIILEPNIDKRLSYFKTLKKDTNFIALESIDEFKLVEWVVQRVGLEEAKITKIDAKYLIELVGNNQLRISNEICKLIQYNSNINRESIDLLVVPIAQSTIFQLLDAAFNGEHKMIIKIYEDQKLQKTEAQQVIALLTWQLHIIALIKVSKSTNSAEIAKEAKINPFVVNKSYKFAQKLTLNEIQNLLNNLLELDVKLKNESIDSDDALLRLLLSIN